MKKYIFYFFTLILSIFAVFAVNAANVNAAIGDCNTRSMSFIKSGQRGGSVKNIQNCLIKLGYNIPYGATGYYGNQTKEAIKKFYSDILGMNWTETFGPKGISAVKKILSTVLIGGVDKDEIVKFSNKEEFKYYLTKFEDRQKSRGTGAFGMFKMEEMTDDKSFSPLAADRISETNVQVAGIDEPDILKIDGERIYFSPEKKFYILDSMPQPMMDLKIMPPFPPDKDFNKTKIFKAYPPEDLAEENKIDGAGDLLLIRDKKMLAILENNQVIGYSLSDSKKPEKKWDLKFEDNNFYVTARLFNGKIYLITRNYIDRIAPCPMKSFIFNGSPIVFPCGEIYHSRKFTAVDTNFTAVVLNPETGAIENKISFAGSGDNSVIYMSENSLYITYVFNENLFDFTLKVLEETNKGLLPDSVMDKVLKLKSYEISEEAKLFEYNKILEDYYKNLNKDERMRIENELANRFRDYYETHNREFLKTGIIKINLSDMKIAANGNVPGTLLNQFSLDEYNGNLRAAVTIDGNRFFGFGFFGGKSANDIYVLNNNLSVIGEIKDLGITERIYSARFIKNKGYLVTFRQIDPFYVLDLSEPSNPQLKGELKIPGYSSYLEPLEGEKILGVGQEDSQIKISMFDVLNPENPSEKDKYTLNEGWSEVLQNHRAFLKDEKHKIFFLPGGNGGYIFSYKDDKLALLKTVSDYAVKRAAYFNDYLYIVGENKITVFNENTWEKVKELEISK